MPLVELDPQRPKDASAVESLLDTDVIISDGSRGVRPILYPKLKQQILGEATGALSYLGLADGDSVPASAPSAGGFYLLRQSGESQGTAWQPGDTAVFNGTSWDRVPGLFVQGSLNIETYGAKAHTDATYAISNDLAFAAAIAEASVSGATIFVPPAPAGKFYAISTPIVGANNVTIYGLGMASKIVQTHVKLNCLDFVNKSNIQLRDLHFKANGNFALDSNPGQAYCCVRFEDCNTIQVDRCTFTGSAYSSVYFTRCYNFVIERCSFPDPGWHDPYSTQQQTNDISIDDSHDATVERNLCYSTGNFAGGIGISINGGLREALLGGAPADSYNLIIRFNLVRRKTEYGIMAYNQGPPSNPRLTSEINFIKVLYNDIDNIDGSYHHVAEGTTYDYTKINEGTGAGNGIYMQSSFRSILRGNNITNCGLYTRANGVHVKGGIGWSGTPDGICDDNLTENCWYNGIVLNNSSLQGDKLNKAPKMSDNKAINCGCYVASITVTTGSPIVTLAVPTAPLEPAQAAHCLGGFWIGDKVVLDNAGAAGVDLEATVIGINAGAGTLTLDVNSSMTGTTAMALSELNTTKPSVHMSIGAICLQRPMLTDNQVTKDAFYELGRTSAIVVQGVGGGADATFGAKLTNNQYKGHYIGIRLVNTEAAELSGNQGYQVITDAIQCISTNVRPHLTDNHAYGCDAAININSVDGYLSDNFGQCNKGIVSTGTERLVHNRMDKCTTPYPNNKPGIRSITAASTTAQKTISSADETILADATAGAITVALPAARIVAGRTFAVKKTDASANAVTVDPDSTEKMDGADTKAITTQWGTLRFQSDGSNWFTV